MADNLENPELGSRRIPLAANFILTGSFHGRTAQEVFRMFPGNEVRLMNAYFVKCTGFEKDENGKVTVVHGTYDRLPRAEYSPDGRKVKGTIHWVNASTAVEGGDASLRKYYR